MPITLDILLSYLIRLTFDCCMSTSTATKILRKVKQKSMMKQKSKKEVHSETDFSVDFCNFRFNR